MSTSTQDTAFFFLSYSRKQFYAAETLAIQLEQGHVNVWFDVQQLTPGIPWAAAIDDGLQRCAGVILLASTAALASPYVEKEWTRVQDSGMPVCVCLFEDVQLPERLQRPEVLVIDMRRRFDAGVKRIIAFAQGKPITNDRGTLSRTRIILGVSRMGYLN